VSVRRVQRVSQRAPLLGMLSLVACYRAQIDLEPKADAAAGSAGAKMTDSNGGGGATSEPPASGGTGGTAGASETAGSAGCDDNSVDDTQLECRTALPTKSQCAEQDANGWNGCTDGGCNVCVDVAVDYAYYFSWHPCCLPNLYCAASTRVKCNSRCPAPTPHDRLRPCWLVRGN
jgi:hypothetical protein